MSNHNFVGRTLAHEKNTPLNLHLFSSPKTFFSIKFEKTSKKISTINKKLGQEDKHPFKKYNNNMLL